MMDDISFLRAAWQYLARASGHIAPHRRISRVAEAQLSRCKNFRMALYTLGIYKGIQILYRLYTRGTKVESFRCPQSVYLCCASHSLSLSLFLSSSFYLSAHLFSFYLLHFFLLFLLFQPPIFIYTHPRSSTLLRSTSLSILVSPKDSTGRRDESPDALRCRYTLPLPLPLSMSVLYLPSWRAIGCMYVMCTSEDAGSIVMCSTSQFQFNFVIQRLYYDPMNASIVPFWKIYLNMMCELIKRWMHFKSMNTFSIYWLAIIFSTF